MKKTATLNWEVFSVRRITDLRVVSLLASSLGFLRVGKDWGKGRSSPFPPFSPPPAELPPPSPPSQQHPLAGESLVNQSQSINISVSYKDAPDSILFPRRKDYPGYLVWTDARENNWRYLDRGAFLVSQGYTKGTESGYVKRIDCCCSSQSCAKGIVLSAYNHSQNAPVELWTRYQTNFFREWFLKA